MEEVTKRKGLRFSNSLRPFFPGYMFVGVETKKSPWRSINNTLGVSKLVMFNGQPKSIPENLILGLKIRCDASGKMLPSKNLKTGDKIKILKGPFAHFNATIETIDASERIWALMRLMGQETRIRLNPEKVQLVH